MRLISESVNTKLSETFWHDITCNSNDKHDDETEKEQDDDDT